jgi:hypothetical protein
LGTTQRPLLWQVFPGSHPPCAQWVAHANPSHTWPALHSLSAPQPLLGTQPFDDAQRSVLAQSLSAAQPLAQTPL